MPWVVGGARTGSPGLPGPLILSQRQTPQRWESCRSPFALRSPPQPPGHPHPRPLWSTLSVPPGILGARLEGWGLSRDPGDVGVWGHEATFPELAFLPSDPEPPWQARPQCGGEVGGGDVDALASEVCSLGT